MNLLKYQSLPPDPASGSPLDKYGEINAWRLGPYWTVAASVPLIDLKGLRAEAIDKSRLASVVQAWKSGAALPPIEVAVWPKGDAWIVDGNHRLVAARKAKAPSIDVIFTWVAPMKTNPGDANLRALEHAALAAPGDAAAEQAYVSAAMRARAPINTFVLANMVYRRGTQGMVHYRGGALVFKPNGKVTKVKNLGWLLKHAGKNLISLVEIVGGPPRHGGAELVVRFDDGTVFVSDFASLVVLWGFLDRPVFHGAPAVIHDGRTGEALHGVVTKGQIGRPVGQWAPEPSTDELRLRENPDEGRRSRERRARVEGGVAGEVARLTDEIRSGRLPSDRVMYAAALGDEAARAAVPDLLAAWLASGDGELARAQEVGNDAWARAVLVGSVADSLRWVPWGREIADVVWDRSLGRLNAIVSSHVAEARIPADRSVVAMTQGNYGEALNQAAYAYAVATGEQNAVSWRGASMEEITRQRDDLVASLLRRPLPDSHAINPPRGDAHRRALERRAAQGDPEAAAALQASQDRLEQACAWCGRPPATVFSRDGDLVCGSCAEDEADTIKEFESAVRPRARRSKRFTCRGMDDRCGRMGICCDDDSRPYCGRCAMKTWGFMLEGQTDDPHTPRRDRRESIAGRHRKSDSYNDALRKRLGDVAYEAQMEQWYGKDWRRKNPQLPTPAGDRFLPALATSGALPRGEYVPPVTSFELATSGAVPLVYVPEGSYENEKANAALTALITTPGALAAPSAWDDLIARVGTRGTVYLIDRRGEQWRVRDVVYYPGGRDGALDVEHLGRRGKMRVDLREAYGHVLPVLVYKPLRANPGRRRRA